MISARLRPLLLLATVLILAAVAFSPGLSGELILDDQHNLAPIIDYAQGRAGWRETIFSASGLLGRPLSMATFTLNASTAASRADLLWSFKLTNLAIHLCTGLLVYLLCGALLRNDKCLAPRSQWMALTIAALWLLAPLQVSTVLYTIQRMAQLSTLFMLGGLLTYVIAREQINLGRAKRGAVLLFLIFPLTALLGMFSKENALLLPVLAAVVELTYFVRHSPPSRLVRVFHILFVWIPCALALVYLAIHPEVFTAGYATRDFTLFERIISQPRALFSYLGSLFVPNAHGLGLFHDDFVASTSLSAPPSTLLSIVGWLCILAIAAIAWIKNRPTICFGILFFLAAHAMESSIFALELYFEHRNYLPAVGAIAALVAGINWALQYSTKLHRMSPALVLIYIALFSAATWARAGVWASTETIIEQAAKGHPDSPRVRVHLATRSAREKDINLSLAHLEFARTRDPVNAPTYALNEVSIYCIAELPVPQSAYDAVTQAAPTRLNPATTGTYRTIVEQIEANYCPQLDLEKLKAAVGTWIASIDLAVEPDSYTMHQSWLLRMFHSKLLARLGHLNEAVLHSQRAYELVPDRVDVGLYLVQLQLASQSGVDAMVTLQRIESRYKGGKPKYDTALAELTLAAQGLLDKDP